MFFHGMLGYPRLHLLFLFVLWVLCKIIQLWQSLLKIVFVWTCDYLCSINKFSSVVVSSQMEKLTWVQISEDCRCRWDLIPDRGFCLFDCQCFEWLLVFFVRCMNALHLLFYSEFLYCFSLPLYSMYFAKNLMVDATIKLLYITGQIFIFSSL